MYIQALKNIISSVTGYCTIRYICAVCILATPVAEAQGDTLEKLISKAPATHVSAVVVDLHNVDGEDKNNFFHRPNDLHKPASVQKLLTSVVALNNLGVTFQFATKFFIAKEKNRTVLSVVGGGDPSLTTSDLHEVVEALRARGISSIDTVIIDETLYTDSRIPKGTRAYHAAASSIALNYNSRSVVSCKAKSVSECDENYVSVERPTDNFITELKKVLSEKGFHTKEFFIRPVSRSERGELAYEFRSAPLPKLLFDLNHFSTNMIADSLIYALGCKEGECSFARGLEAIHQWLKKQKISDVSLMDGSGLSTENRLSAKSLAQVIGFALENPKINAEFLSSLSIGGISGTLRSRSFDPSVIFRGKTGSLDGVITIAGVLRTKSGKDKIITLILNGVSDVQKAKSWEELFIHAVYEQ